MAVSCELSQARFVQQQGFASGPISLYQALMLQPRLVCGAVALGIGLQSAAWFLALGAVLLWCAVMPAWNPVDHLYNLVRLRGAAALTPAPAPRRTAMGMAAACSGVIGVSILAQLWPVAWVVEGLLLLAALIVVVGRFCFGSFVYYQWQRWAGHGGTKVSAAWGREVGTRRL